MTGIGIQSASDFTGHKQQEQLKTLVQQLYDTTRKIEPDLIDLWVSTKTDVEAMVETGLNKWQSILQSRNLITI